MLSRRRWLPVLFVPVIVAAGCVSAKDLEEPPAALQSKARELGLDPKVGARLEIANREFYENRPTEKLFQQVVDATKSRDVATRSEAFTTLATLRGTTFQKRALVEVQRMKSDPSPKIQERYAWVSYLAESPTWKDACEAATQTGSPEGRRLAEQALQMGPRPPKRKFYDPNRKK